MDSSLGAAPGATPSPGTASPGPVVDMWVHTDPRGMGKAIESAMARSGVAGYAIGGANWEAKIPGPTAGEPTPAAIDLAVADFRALLIASLYAADDLSSTPPLALTPAQAAMLELPGGTLVSGRNLGEYSDGSIAFLGVQLQLAWIAICERYLVTSGSSGTGTVRARTDGGGAPIELVAKSPLPTGEAAGWPLALVAVAGIASLTYLGAKAMDCYSLNVAREEDTRRLVRLIAEAADVGERHAELQAKTGTVLPLNDAEKGILSALNSLTTDYGAATKEREKQKEGGSTVGGAVASALGSAATLVVILVGLYLFSKSTK